MKRILCFGDSNAWGHIPGSGCRYSQEDRWPGVAASILGEDYEIIEESISGRTTVFNDPELNNRCGLASLGYALLAHLPLDLVIVALGTNDLKFTDVAGHENGLRTLVNLVVHAGELLDLPSPLLIGDMKLLLVGPPPIAPEIEVMRPEHRLAHAAQTSLLLPDICQSVALEVGAYYINSADYVYPSLADCLHLSPEDHRKLGKVMAQKIREILP